MSISEELGEARTVELPRGARIAYRERGEGPVLLFVHGLFVNGDHWRKVVPLLADRYRCIAPDLPFGAHEHALPDGADRSAAGLARLIADFVEALGLDEVTVISNDTGDAITQVLVTEYPAGIARVVLTPGDAFTNFLPWVIKPVRPLAWAPPLFHAVLKTFRTRAGQWALLVTIAKNFPEKRVLEGYFGPPLRDPAVRRDLREIIKAGKPSYTMRAARKLRELPFPALIVWQKAPSAVFPKFHGRRLAKIIPDARLEEVGGTLAFIPEDQPARLADLIAEFVPAGAAVR
jgi:pimeloyl-ACP methyl ester carboxylesterase